MPSLNVVPVLDGFTLGCDPELFLLNPDGRPAPAEGLLPGTKDAPFPVEGGWIQVDGCAAEINIKPAATFLEWENNIETVLLELERRIPAGYTFSPSVTAVFDDDVWRSTPSKAKQLGCSPDFNAWTGSVNPPPSPKNMPQMRCAGGHVHVGWCENEDITSPEHISNCRDLVKQLDYFVGLHSLQVDKDTTRRGLYGQAGACRIKPYGVEYRTPSNYWIFDRKYRLSMWNRVNAAVHFMATQFLPGLKTASFNDSVVYTINQSYRDRMIEKSVYFPVFDWQNLEMPAVSVPPSKFKMPIKEPEKEDGGSYAITLKKSSAVLDQALIYNEGIQTLETLFKPE